MQQEELEFQTLLNKKEKQDLKKFIRSQSLQENGPKSAIRGPENPNWKSPKISMKKRMTMMKRIGPFLWPDDIILKLEFFLAVLVLIGARVVNVYVPITFKNAVNALTDDASDTSQIYIPTGFLIAYGILKFTSTAQKDIRSLLWLRVGQNTRRRISITVFRHLHALSLKFHLTRKTGEVLRVIDRGTSSIESLLNIFVFSVAPTLMDVGIACLVFLSDSEYMIAGIIFATIVSYLLFTFSITEWRTKFRKNMNQAENQATDRAVDSLLNFETVKYFGNEDFEAEQYNESVAVTQKAQIKSEVTLALMDFGQSMILSVGLVLSMYIAATRVVQGNITVGGFVMVNTYIMQLTTPLNWLGTSYRMIQNAFVDMEKMIDLLETDTEIKDVANAKNIEITQGHVVFEGVSFSYDTYTPLLRDISFEIEPGKTVAFVGSTGSGKSTISRLLFRFYDVQKGRIVIDNQDIRSVKQVSLRQSIGVVPQDTVLFNNSIRYNIAYGKTNCTDDEVIAVAKQAQIHSKILTFKDGYDTKVGERGLRLSGGEKQRVAIARTLLKNPKIVILDEATSALDNKTERQIQEALKVVTTNRSTLVIAHRLSTVAAADLILVLHDGVIVERGTHEQLLDLGGEYSQLWGEQLKEAETMLEKTQ